MDDRYDTCCVYLSPARLAVLDEATCHLDPAAEAAVERAFAARPGALVVIAHRISSALRARRVLLMDGADPVLGSHDEVLARSALYRDRLDPAARARLGQDAGQVVADRAR